MLFAPEKLPNQFSSMTGHIEYPEYLKNQIVPIRRFEQSFTEFLPKDFIHTKTFALFVGKPGLHQLSVEIKAREFPEPITQILEINIDFETPNE